MHRLAYVATAAVFAAVPVSVGLIGNSSLIEEVPVHVPRSAAPLDGSTSSVPQQTSSRRLSTGDEHRRSDRASPKTSGGATHPEGRRTQETGVPVRHHEGGGPRTVTALLVSHVSPVRHADGHRDRDRVQVVPPPESPRQGPGGGGNSTSGHGGGDGGGGGPGPSAQGGSGHSTSGSGSGSGSRSGPGSPGSGSGSSGSRPDSASDSGADSGSGGSGSGGSGSG
jgi:hypothetical protein